MTGHVLGHYRLEEKLGAGAMGEVYRARDEKLNRDVAVKVLPAGALSDEAARRRFRKEADVLSRISHPHIATIHDFDSADGIDFLVMELVPGPSIDEELRRGPVPEKDVVRLGGQIARGLQAAHEQGVIHRDLKPSNLRLTEDGMLKILDFGVARLEQNARRAAGDATATETADGQVVGTLPYMAPEQLRGRGVDARTDLYAAGAVLHEMATGRRLFSKPSTAELTDAILNQAPPSPREVNARVSSGLEAVILKALDKDPELRYQTAKDLRVDLERLQQRSGSHALAMSAAAVETPSGPLGQAPRYGARTRGRVVWAGLALLLAGLAAFLAPRGRQPPPEAGSVVRFRLDVPEGLRGEAIPAVSPDGRHVALARLAGGELWVRPLDEAKARRLPGTENALGRPFWSPDGASIAFFASEQTGRALKQVHLATGAIHTVCRVPSENPAGGSWSPDGRVVFSVALGGKEQINLVAATGGEPEVLFEPTAQELGHQWPQFLPDGRRFLFYGDPSTAQVGGTWLATVDPPHDRRMVRPGPHGVYAAPGHLLSVHEGNLMAQPFDPARGEVSGEPSIFAASVGSFSVSATGVLVYQEQGDPNFELVWFDRKGQRLGTVGQPAHYSQIQLSPDETRVAVDFPDDRDIWSVDLDRGVRTRLTSDPAKDVDPVWSPDGRELFFSSDRDGPRWRLHRQRLDGSGRASLVAEIPGHAWPESVSPDGAWLVYHAGGAGVWTWPLRGSGEAELLVKSGSRVDEPHVSPDGRWLLFGSNEAGDWDVYVMPFRREGEKLRVSPQGGRQPRWRADGRELFYVTAQGELMAVDVREGDGRLELGTPRPLFQAGVSNPLFDNYAVTKDGQRFLVMSPVAEPDWSIQVVLNWPSLLEQ